MKLSWWHYLKNPSVVLDTLTTRFFMVFLFFLFVPMFSLTFFTMNTLENVFQVLPLSQQTDLLHHYYIGIRFIVLSSLLLSGILALMMARNITQPLFKLIAQVDLISRTGMTSQSIVVKGVHEIHQLGQSFNRMLERLRQEQQHRDEFVATLTHDLKVPLLAEQQALRHLQQGVYGPLSAEQKEVLQIFQSTHQTSLQMINSMLEVYRYAAGRVTLQKTQLPMTTLLEESIVSLESLAQEKHIEIRFTPPSKPLLGWGDALEIKRVLVNLLSNAIANTPKHGVITCRLIDSASLPGKENGFLKVSDFISSTLQQRPPLLERMVVSIQDSGIGFTQEDLPFLFKRFAANKGRNPMSIGLGLYHCYQVIEAHDGVLWVETTEGEGAAVNFTLPTPPEEDTP